MVVHQAAEGLRPVAVVSLHQTLEFLRGFVVELDLQSLHNR